MSAMTGWLCYPPSMNYMLAALVATFVIAVTASVFAVWPVVADPPWEDDVTPPQDETTSIRCQEALDLRERLIFENPYGDDAVGWRQAMDVADREIDSYC